MMRPSPLRGKEILITAGSNRAPIDAVRFISNRSTGKLGTEIALECLRLGAFVTFLHGTDSHTPVKHQKETGETEPSLENLECIEVETLFDLVGTLEHLVREGEFDVAIHSMAVLDYIPDHPSIGKTKSGLTEWTITLIQAPKVISMFKKLSPSTFLVGFKMEVGATPEELCESAKRLAEQNQCDLVVANDLNAINEGQHVAYIYRPGDDSSWESGRAIGKDTIALKLCDTISAMLAPVRPE